MDLYEYQSKKLLSQYNIPIPYGYVCSSILEIENAISNIEVKNKIFTLKCQIQAGGRGKSGGVKTVKYKKDAVNFAKKWLGNRLVTSQTNSLGLKVNSLLVEENINIIKEIYLSITIDRSKYNVILVASSAGGVEIENLIKDSPYLLSRIVIDPTIGFQSYQGRKIAFDLGLNVKQINQFNEILMRLINLFFEKDCSLIEINPLVINSEGNFMCLDSKITIDDNALFRQSELSKIYSCNQENEIEVQAHKLNMSYVSLDYGNIGCMVNGAGLAMATLDIINLYGGQPANFLDIGGNSKKENVIKALKLILENKKIKVILINIFGGIVRCDFVAQGIIEVINETNTKLPIIIRLEGNKSELGINLINKSKVSVIITKNLVFAIQQAVYISRK